MRLGLWVYIYWIFISIFNNTQDEQHSHSPDEEPNNAHVYLDFEERCAQLLSPSITPDDYDSSTLFKTATRLNNKLHRFPDDVKNVLKANLPDTGDDQEEREEDNNPDNILYSQRSSAPDDSNDSDDDWHKQNDNAPMTQQDSI